MPEGPLGGRRPLARCRIVLVIIGDEDNLPPAREAEAIIAGEAAQFNRTHIGNVMEGQINTNNFSTMVDRGVRKAILIEVSYNDAINLNRFSEDLDAIATVFRENFNLNTFLVAR